LQQLLAVWSGLDVRRKAIVAISTVAMFATVLSLSRMATTPQMQLLYSGLESSAAGDVVAVLEQRGVAYEIRGGSILVDQNQRDALRMTLAAEGLPANGAAGYELLDNLSGFGTTSQMFDAAYWRAKEGELARTILASPHVRAARVHIANTGGQPFRRNQKTTAAVTATPSSGAMSPAQANALRHLVASAVAGLEPGDVSVIDGSSGIVVAADDSQTGFNGAAGDRAEMLRANVERLLAARMGPGKAVVEVSVETQTDRESIIERTFDPESRVAISTETEERSTDATDQGGANVTVASNLAEEGSPAGRNSSSTNSETRERVNYEVSETQREVVRGPGAIQRISVAVLLDGVRSIAADGSEQWAPLPPEQLDALRELVASAVGLNEARGDVITLKSMPFQLPPAAGTEAISPGLLSAFKMDPTTLVPLGVLALVALILGLFVVRPILTSRPNALPALPPVDAADSALAPANGISGEIEFEDRNLPDLSVVSDAGTANALAQPDADPVSRLRLLIDERRDETVEILRNWIEDEHEEPA